MNCGAKWRMKSLTETHLGFCRPEVNAAIAR
jgi:hypothetical protein